MVGAPASEQMVYLDPYIEHCPDALFLAEVDGELEGPSQAAPTGRRSRARTSG